MNEAESKEHRLFNIIRKVTATKITGISTNFLITIINMILRG
jgi:hypothetical protein